LLRREPDKVWIRHGVRHSLCVSEKGKAILRSFRKLFQYSEIRIPKSFGGNQVTIRVGRRPHLPTPQWAASVAHESINWTI
jgi:hypothetical protein